MDLHGHFNGKLMDLLSKYFDSSTIESGELRKEFNGKKTEQQHQDYFVFFHRPDAWGDADNLTTYQLFQSKTFLESLKVDLLPSYHQMAYKILRFLYPELARKIEPFCLEISAVNYIKARK